MQPFYCSSCGKPNAPDAKFCNECAKPLSQTAPVEPMWQPLAHIACPSCRMMNPSNYEFCHVCHKPLFYAQPAGATTPQPAQTTIKTVSAEQEIRNWWNGQTPTGKKIFAGFAIVVLVIIIIGVIRAPNNPVGGAQRESSSSTSKPAAAPEPPPARTELNAAVRFNGTQFVITNKESTDLTNIKMEINGGIFSGGYQLRHDTMKAGQTYTVGAMQFADGDGKRFNPFQMKPQKFTISADSSIGHLFYVGGWN